MENNSRGGSDRREKRPRIGAVRRPSEGAERAAFSTERPRRSYSDNNRSFGERRSYSSNNGEGRSFGQNSERRSYGQGGGNRSYGNNGGGRSYNGGEGRSYSNGGRSFNGEGRSFGQGGEGRSYGNNAGRSFNGGNRQGGNRSYGNNGGARSFNGGEGRSYGQGGGRSFNNGGARNFNSNGGGRSFNNSKGQGFNRGGNNLRKPFKQDSDEGINRMLSRKPVIDPSQYSDNDLVQAPIKEEVRLNKFIANSGMCSRREADNFIQAGVVTVNGVVVTELGTKINSRTDDVRFNGERLRGEEKVYIVMNKPKGFVTTASDPHAEKTVMDLLSGCSARVFPVGRLDKATTGVLMFTNDGEMAEKLTHPAYNKKKIYQVSLNNKLSQEDFDKIKSGVTLQDGEIAADDLEYIDENDHRKIGIEIHSGKNRIVRRIFESLGYEVKALDRVYFAGLTKKNLKKGQWRYLSEGEVNILKIGAYV